MSKKKRFGISEALTRGLSETINVVENNSGIFRNVILPLSRIELDPENPRKLSVDLFDVRQGIRPDDPLYQRKQDEMERLRELAHTIKSSGVINPIVVYKLGEFYRIVAGERRCLASIIAGKQEIEARVFNEKPKGFELKLLQWIENTAREDLTLHERLGNVRDIIHEYLLQHGTQDVTATLLKNVTGLSLAQCSYYLAVLNAPSDVKEQIETGQIRNLDKAAFLAGITNVESRKNAIQLCIEGASLKALKNLIGQHKQLAKNKPVSQSRGRTASKINMGSTLKPGVIKSIVMSVLMQTAYAKHQSLFKDIDWIDIRQASRAFRKLIEIMELDAAV